ncbi:MAG: isochorismatase [Deltaproteobacteria bacterium]
MKELPIPSHYNPEKVSQVWKVDYEHIAEAAMQWAQVHQISPASGDEKRTCLLLIDVQNTFCIPGFELYVGGRSGMGAVEDNKRLCGFIYRNLGKITQIIPTMDTHQAMQIFHAAALLDSQGRRPKPFTQITQIDAEIGDWRLCAEFGKTLGVSLDYLKRYLSFYTGELHRKGKYSLTAWPYHAMLGGIGHALVSAVEEAIFFHSIARYSQPRFHQKGLAPLTEYYSALSPEIASDPEGKPIAPQNQELIEALMGFDAVIIAGQAKSHCVAWTIDDLLIEIGMRDARYADRVHILEDCASPVVIPGVIDYTDEAERAFRKFADAGVKIVKSEELVI